MVHPHHHALAHRRPELSQHFARDTVARLIAARLAQQPRLVVEAGAGAGAITQALVNRGFRVIAVEKDPALHRLLRSRFASANVECVLGDFLDVRLPREPYAVVSNVPFTITAALIGKLLAADPPPSEALLVVQREAAERFMGSPRETRIALLHKPWFQVAIEHAFRRDDFVPPPSVDCVLLRITPRPVPLVPRRLATEYRAFIDGAFGARRQSARDSLRLYFTERQFVRLARDLDVERHARPSEISFEAWLGLFRFHARGRLGRAPRLGIRSLRPPHGCGLTQSLHNAKLVAPAGQRPYPPHDHQLEEDS